MSEAPTYLAKIESFEQLYDDRVAMALPYAANDAGMAQEIKSSQAIIKAAIRELVDRYKAQFLTEDASPSKDDVIDFMHLEANIAMASQQTLDAMQKLIKLETKAFKVAQSTQRRLLRHSMNKITTSLERRDDATPLSPLIGIKEMMCAGRKPVKTGATVVGLILLHRPLSDWRIYLDPNNFFRSGDVVFEGVDDAIEILREHPRRVMVTIGNHDSSLYDGTIAHRLAISLGTDQHIRMVRKSVYPIPPPESAGDVVYVDEHDPKLSPVAQSVAKIQDALTRNDVVSLSVYPEGMLPFAGAQMPLASKEGAFLIARKLAIKLHDQNIPVFIVETKSNTLRHLTLPEETQARVRISSVDRVPADPLVKGRRDGWIARRRVESENRFNADRGERMVDIVASKRIPDAITYEASGLSREWSDSASRSN